MLRLQTTALMDIRALLERYDAAPPPWMPRRDILESLFALVRSRKEDDLFWRELTVLMEHLQDRRFRPTFITGAEVFDSAGIERLLAELRACLPASDAQPLTFHTWSRTVPGTSALAGLLLLATAAACNPVCEEAGDAHIYNEEAGIVYCELIDIVDEADLDHVAEAKLRECLPELSEDDREALLTQFEEATEEELETLLMRLALSEECNPESFWDHDDGGSH